MHGSSKGLVFTIHNDNMPFTEMRLWQAVCGSSEIRSGTCPTQAVGFPTGWRPDADSNCSSLQLEKLDDKEHLHLFLYIYIYTYAHTYTYTYIHVHVFILILL